MEVSLLLILLLGWSVGIGALWLAKKELDKKKKHSQS